jgi:hypothetical protein
MLLKTIKIIHLLIIIFVVLTPFFGNKGLIKINLIFLGHVSLRFLTGNESCGLTDLEHYVSQKKYKSGFVYRILEPIYKMNESNFYLVFNILVIIYLFFNLYLLNIV